jgi:hypothetical protein
MIHRPGAARRTTAAESGELSLAGNALHRQHQLERALSRSAIYTSLVSVPTAALRARPRRAATSASTGAAHISPSKISPKDFDARRTRSS